MNQASKQIRVLGISLSSRGFGYAVIEGDNTIIDFGKKRFDVNKNVNSLASIENMIARNQPGFLILQDVNNAKGTTRVSRIKKLHWKIVKLAKRQKIKLITISGKQLRAILLGNENGTKQEMAELLAKQFPDELASRLPPERKAWTSEDSRMDIFDAAALGVSFIMRNTSLTYA